MAKIGRQIKALDKEFKGNIADLLLTIQKAKDNRTQRVEAVRQEFGDQAASVIGQLLQAPATTIMSVVLGGGSETKGKKRFENFNLALGRLESVEKKLDQVIELKQAEAEKEKQLERRLSESMFRPTVHREHTVVEEKEHRESTNELRAWLTRGPRR